MRRQAILDARTSLRRRLAPLAGAPSAVAPAAWAALAALFALAAILAAVQPAGAAAPATSDLHGVWKLNPDLTAHLAKDQPEKPADSARQGGMHGGGGTDGMQSHGGIPDAGAAFGGNVAGSSSDHDDDRRKADLISSLSSLTITQQAGVVTITDAHGHVRALKTDGSKIRDENGPGGAAQLQAKWNQDGDLVVEVKPARGPKHTEYYSVSHDRKHLYVALSLYAGFMGQAPDVVRAYDPSPAADAPAAGAAPPATAAPPPSPPPPAARR
jgi:hypothetical protein